MKSSPIETVLDKLAIPGAKALFAEGWDAAAAERPREKVPFLTEQYLRQACSETLLSDAMREAVLAAARKVNADACLVELAWYMHWRLFRSEGPRPRVDDWPLLSESMGLDAGAYNVIVLLSGTPDMHRVHQRRGIPPDVVRETIIDLRQRLEDEDYTRDYGHYGISPRILSWLLNHWRGELYWLGRLQYIPYGFQGRLRAFRHQRTGRVAALSEPGVTYRADGQIDGAGGVHDTEGAWTSTLAVTDEAAVGHPVHPTGYVGTETVRLSAADWHQVLAPGDPLLNIHIPAGSPMDYDACGESLRRAIDFFGTHFPERPFVGFDCISWILDHQFEQLLPPASNLVRFQKELYLFPWRGVHDTAVGHVFGQEATGGGERPQQTTMQRAFAGHIRRGGRFCGGGGFLLVDDFDWGAQVYRRGG